MATATKSAKKPIKKAAKSLLAKPSKKPATRTSGASLSISGAIGIKTFARTILYVGDFDAALRFYRDTLGLALAYPADDGWAEFATGATALCIHSGRPAGAKSEAVCSVGFSVERFDAACAALRAKGVAVGDPHSPCEGLRIAAFKDPSGNDLYVEGK